MDEKFLKKELSILKENGWISDNDLKKEEIRAIQELLNKHDNRYCTPKKEDIFNAFKLFPFNETRVLILGQDPYPDKDKAHGYAFSFKNGNKAEDSLLNIFKAIIAYKKDKKIDGIKNWKTNLKNWAKNNQILLLNTALTYEEENKKSEHQAVWNSFIKNIIINLLTRKSKNLIVFLWGKDAQDLFFQSMNQLNNNENGKWNENIKNLVNEIGQDNLNKKNKSIKKINKLKKVVRKQDGVELSKQIKLYFNNHPSQISENNDGKFAEFSPIHFKACDAFLGKNADDKYIWLDFPENKER